jgi:hypothetical protein
MANATKSGSGGRRSFVRTQVPRVERVASALIIGVLVATGIWVAFKGRHFDPAQFNVRADSLKSTAEAVEGKSGTAPSGATVALAAPATPTAATPAPAVKAAEGEGESAEGGEGHGTAAAPQPAATGIPLELSLPGIKPMSATEFYNADNLFEKIDGRAPAYQAFNIQQLRSRSFSVTAATGSFVDVYEYRFDTPVNAFGMFAMERDPKGKPLDFAPDGYSGELGYFFRQGAVYVQIIASDQKTATATAAKLIAQNRAQELPADDHGLAGRRKLPAAGLVADSVAFVSENAQGQASLKEVFQAKYQFNGAELPFFIMVASPEDAAKAWQSFQTFCGRFGKTEVLPDVNGGKIFSALVFGKTKIIYQREGELGGVFDAKDPGQARTFVEQYLRGEIK